MLRLPEGVTLDDVFSALPNLGDDPDLRAMLISMHDDGSSVYRAAKDRAASGESLRCQETLYYHLFRAQRRIYQKFGQSAGDIVADLRDRGSVIVDNERLPEIEAACRMLGIPIETKTRVTLQR